MIVAQPIRNRPLTTLAIDRILRELLKDRRMTASQLARSTRVSRKTIQNWLAGSCPSNVEQLKRVADVLSVTLEELCFGNAPVANSSSADALPFGLGLGTDSELMKYEVTVRRL